jgi:hypothetical protein
MLIGFYSIPAAPPKLTNHPASSDGFLILMIASEIESAGRGAKAGFRRACSPLPERIRACKREDREIPAVSPNK